GVAVACEFLTGTSFPWAILLVNGVGCFLFGVVAVSMASADPAYHWVRVTLATGFLGGLTTFSSFSFDTYRLLQTESWWLGLVNIGANLIIGLSAVAGGMWLARQLAA